MTTPDPLQAFFDAAPVAERDIAFRSQVMERIARRRLRVELALRFAAGALLVAIFAVSAPLVLPVSTALSGDLLQAVLVCSAAVALGLTCHAWLTARLRIGRWVGLPR